MGWTEIEPTEYYEAFCAITREILQKSRIAAGDIAAVSVSSASQTTAYLDENDKPVRPSLFWTDNRSLDIESWLRKEYGEKIYSECHNVASSSRSLTHLIWISRNEPENFARIRRIMFMKDYVRSRLTGDFVTDYIDAMGSHLMDVPHNCWSDELVGLTGLPKSALPEIVAPADIVGTVSKKAAEETGLMAGTKS